MKKVFVDSDVFIRDLRYPRDVHTKSNEHFLQKIKNREIQAATSIFNLLEICGVLSFNYSPLNLRSLYCDFTNRYPVSIFFPSDNFGNLQYDTALVFDQIQRKQGLGDAQVSYVIERFSDQISCIVSWNAKHFQGKISIPAKTPQEF